MQKSREVQAITKIEEINDGQVLIYQQIGVVISARQVLNKPSQALRWLLDWMVPLFIKIIKRHCPIVQFLIGATIGNRCE